MAGSSRPKAPRAASRPSDGPAMDSGESKLAAMKRPNSAWYSSVSQARSRR